MTLNAAPLLIATGSVLAGLCWIGQVFVPWAGSGALSQSSGLDLWQLWRDHLLPSSISRFVPGIAALPLVGVVVLALAGATGRRQRQARRVLLGWGLLTSVTAIALAHSRLDGIGFGLGLTGGAAVFAAMVLVVDVRAHHDSAAESAETEIR